MNSILRNESDLGKAYNLLLGYLYQKRKVYESR